MQRCNTPNGTLSLTYRQFVVSLQISSHGDSSLWSRALTCDLAQHDCDEFRMARQTQAIRMAKNIWSHGGRLIPNQ